MQLDDAVHDARSAMRDLTILMAFYKLDFPTLNILLKWPGPVKAAYGVWVYRMENVARIVAEADGIARGATLSIEDRERLTARALGLVMASLS
jgi:hypothetical protein